MMFDIFKDEAGEWGWDKTIDYDGFWIRYTNYYIATEISFYHYAEPCRWDGPKFGTIVLNKYVKFDQWLAFKEGYVSDTAETATYPEFFDYMLINKPAVAEWLLWNAQ